MRRRCRCWEALAAVCGVAFGVLEREGYINLNPDPNDHRTLSRKLGSRWALVFPAAGLVMAWHLLHLPPLTQEPSC